jgi:hypothetical protein
MVTTEVEGGVVVVARDGQPGPGRGKAVEREVESDLERALQSEDVPAVPDGRDLRGVDLAQVVEAVAAAHQEELGPPPRPGGGPPPQLSGRDLCHAPAPPGHFNL